MLFRSLDVLRDRGASFFGPLHDAVGAGYPAETVDALWNLVWQGLITNDTFHALRAFTRSRAPRRRVKGRHVEVTAFRSRRLAPPSAEGRWTLVPHDVARGLQASARSAKAVALRDNTNWAAAVTQQLLARHGVVTREAVASPDGDAADRRRIHCGCDGTAGDVPEGGSWVVAENAGRAGGIPFLPVRRVERYCALVVMRSFDARRPSSAL